MCDARESKSYVCMYICILDSGHGHGETGTIKSSPSDDVTPEDASEGSGHVRISAGELNELLLQLKLLEANKGTTFYEVRDCRYTSSGGHATRQNAATPHTQHFSFSV